SERSGSGADQRKVHDDELSAREQRQQEETPPEDVAVGLERAPVPVILVWEALAEDHRATNPADDPAEGDHGEDGGDERPDNPPAREQGTVSEGGDPEDRGEDPEDDHGVQAVYARPPVSPSGNCNGPLSWDLSGRVIRK